MGHFQNENYEEKLNLLNKDHVAKIIHLQMKTEKDCLDKLNLLKKDHINEMKALKKKHSEEIIKLNEQNEFLQYNNLQMSQHNFINEKLKIENNQLKFEKQILNEKIHDLEMNLKNQQKKIQSVKNNQVSIIKESHSDNQVVDQNENNDKNFKTDTENDQQNSDFILRTKLVENRVLFQNGLKEILQISEINDLASDEKLKISEMKDSSCEFETPQNEKLILNKKLKKKKLSFMDSIIPEKSHSKNNKMRENEFTTFDHHKFIMKEFNLETSSSKNEKFEQNKLTPSNHHQEENIKQKHDSNFRDKELEEHISIKEDIWTEKEKQKNEPNSLEEMKTEGDQSDYNGTNTKVEKNISNQKQKENLPSTISQTECLKTSRNDSDKKLICKTEICHKNLPNAETEKGTNQSQEITKI